MLMNNHKQHSFTSLPKAIYSTLLPLLALLALPLTGCYHARQQSCDTVTVLSERQTDSMSFAATHHYSQNYNFMVKSDSFNLLKQQPEEMLNGMITDTVNVYRHDRIVVADIRIIPTDSVDSVWVQVARDQATFGWTHESSLLQNVVPDDPISQFISIFSDTHLLVFLIIISLISVAYLMRTIFRRNAKIVHFNDISTFYPTLLALTVALAATFYSSIQMFAPDAWQHFYYHPTLNPFTVSPILSIFIISVWIMLIIAIAVIDVVRHYLSASDTMLYLCGLTGVCAINYIVFSIATLYYVGYPMFAAYTYFAISIYVKRSRCVFFCGKCGTPMRSKGHCPVCGTMNE